MLNLSRQKHRSSQGVGRGVPTLLGVPAQAVTSRDLGSVLGGLSGCGGQGEHPAPPASAPTPGSEAAPRLLARFAEILEGINFWGGNLASRLVIPTVSPWELVSPVPLDATQAPPTPDQALAFKHFSPGCPQ